jgi:TolB-like protein/Tfp pilus assembly protein PilF
VTSVRIRGSEETDPQIIGEVAREELARVLASELFRSPERHRNFLRYVVEETLDGRGDHIKEYSLGITVFERGESFDPRLDTIVRTEARRLRAKLVKYYETEGHLNPVRIEFLKGSYVPEFRLLEPMLTPTPSGEEKVPAASLKTNRSSIVIALLAIMLAIAAGWLWMRLEPDAFFSAGEAPSIAVLPFLNLSDSKEGEVFADGLAEELIDSLGKVPGLQVTARASAFQFKGRTIGIQEIGQKLKVRSVLDGSVRKYRDRLRITVQLDDTVNGRLLWSQSYDRDLKDALGMQREISQSVISKLGVSLAGPGGTAPGASPQAPAVVNPEAYQDYLRGRYALNRLTPDSIRTAIDYLEHAIAKDPGFAPAFAALASSYAILPTFTDTPSIEVLPKIRAAAVRALELDSRSAEAHRSLAFAFIYNFDWKAAEMEFQVGLRLSPGDAAAHGSYARFLSRTGRLEESLAQNRIALRLDPASPDAIQAVARSLTYLHRYDEAIQEFKMALALEPDSGTAHHGLGMAYVYKKLFLEGLDELQASRRIQGSDSFAAGQLGYAYAVSGNAEAARQILDQFLRQSNSVRSQALAIADIYVGLGEYDSAFQWLETAIDRRDGAILLMATPLYQPLRSDPRYVKLLRRMKLL